MNLSLTAAQRELLQKIDAAPGKSLPVEEIGRNRLDGYDVLRTLTATDLVAIVRSRPGNDTRGWAMLTKTGINTLTADLRTIAAKTAATTEASGLDPEVAKGVRLLGLRDGRYGLDRFPAEALSPEAASVYAAAYNEAAADPGRFESGADRLRHVEMAAAIDRTEAAEADKVDE